MVDLKEKAKIPLPRSKWIAKCIKHEAENLPFTIEGRPLPYKLMDSRKYGNGEDGFLGCGFGIKLDYSEAAYNDIYVPGKHRYGMHFYNIVFI